MDYKDLANLIFPDAKPIEFYEEKYPERDLPEGAMVVRIGPSPTGSVHIGTIYQALLARTIADKTNGVFFMRVEDTDQKREVENGIKDIIDSLKYFDVLPDEGMDTETTWHGEYGPYRQSMRKEIYQAYAKYLLEQGKAYPCFATAEELEEMRKTQEVAGVKPGYYGVWAKYRNLTVEEAAEKINRAKANGNRVISVGTTSTRTIESVADENGLVKATSGWTNIFIYPGYKWKVIDNLITNFHLPESTLIMLVSSLAGKEHVLNAYNQAVKDKYRFFSFGDAMFIK